MSKTAVLFLVVVAACAYNADATTQDIDQPWPMHTMYGPADPTETLVGADGMDGSSRGGLVDWVSGFEESAKVVATFHPGLDVVESATSWPKVVMTASVGGVEDAIWADVDRDGKRDIVAAGSSSFELHAFFGPGTGSPDELNAAKWTHVPIVASLKNPDGTNVGSRWLRAGYADMDGDGIPDVVACGYSTGALLTYFTSPTPRVSTSYTMHVIGADGACQEMRLVDVDGDGRVDVLMSDRDTICQNCTASQRVYNHRGVGWWRNNGDGTWTFSNIIPEPPGKARWYCATPDLSLIVEGFADEASPNTNHLQLWSRIDAVTWSKVSDLAPGTDVGWYQACAIADMNGDGLLDIVVAYSHADSTINPGEGDQGVVLMSNNGDGTYTQSQISGDAGCKYDNVKVADVNGDGKPDVVESEQGCSGGTTPKGLREGMIWYENTVVLNPFE